MMVLTIFVIGFDALCIFLGCEYNKKHPIKDYWR